MMASAGPITTECGRLLRGGSFANEPRNLRSGIRNRNRPENRNSNRGFRCALGPRREHAAQDARGAKPARCTMQGLPGSPLRPDIPSPPVLVGPGRTSGRAPFRSQPTPNRQERSEDPARQKDPAMRSVPAGSHDRLSSLEGLWRAWRRYRRGKTRQPVVARFDLDADQHICALHHALRTARYAPKPCRLRVIREPKTRLIAAAPVSDRVVQQALVTELGPTFERSYIDHSFAGRPERGTHRAVLSYLKWTRMYRFRLSLDIKSYFPSIRHDRLGSLIFRRLRDPQSRRLVAQFLAEGRRVYASPQAARVLGVEPGAWPIDRGLPIGSYFSQWAGALYLDGVDHFIKRALKIGGYQRYMDDLTLFSDDAHQLVDARAQIEAWVDVHRCLALNPKRWHVTPTAQASTYLGYRISRAGIRPSGPAIRRMKARVRVLAGDLRRLERSLVSYRGWMTFI